MSTIFVQILIVLSRIPASIHIATVCIVSLIVSVLYVSILDDVTEICLIIKEERKKKNDNNKHGKL